MHFENLGDRHIRQGQVGKADGVTNKQQTAHEIENKIENASDRDVTSTSKAMPKPPVRRPIMKKAEFEENYNKYGIGFTGKENNISTAAKLTQELHAHTDAHKNIPQNRPEVQQQDRPEARQQDNFAPNRQPEVKAASNPPTERAANAVETQSKVEIPKVPEKPAEPKKPSDHQQIMQSLRANLNQLEEGKVKLRMDGDNLRAKDRSFFHFDRGKIGTTDSSQQAVKNILDRLENASNLKPGEGEVTENLDDLLKGFLNDTWFKKTVMHDQSGALKNQCINVLLREEILSPQANRSETRASLLNTLGVNPQVFDAVKEKAQIAFSVLAEVEKREPEIKYLFDNYEMTDDMQNPMTMQDFVERKQNLRAVCNSFASSIADPDSKEAENTEKDVLYGTSEAKETFTAIIRSLSGDLGLRNDETAGRHYVHAQQSELNDESFFTNFDQFMELAAKTNYNHTSAEEGITQDDVKSLLKNDGDKALYTEGENKYVFVKAGPEIIRKEVQSFNFSEIDAKIEEANAEVKERAIAEDKSPLHPQDYSLTEEQKEPIASNQQTQSAQLNSPEAASIAKAQELAQACKIPFISRSPDDHDHTDLRGKIDALPMGAYFLTSVKGNILLGHKTPEKSSAENVTNLSQSELIQRVGIAKAQGLAQACNIPFISRSPEDHDHTDLRGKIDALPMGASFLTSVNGNIILGHKTPEKASAVNVTNLSQSELMQRVKEQQTSKAQPEDKIPESVMSAIDELEMSEEEPPMEVPTHASTSTSTGASASKITVEQQHKSIDRIEDALNQLEKTLAENKLFSTADGSITRTLRILKPVVRDLNNLASLNTPETMNRLREMVQLIESNEWTNDSMGRDEDLGKQFNALKDKLGMPQSQYVNVSTTSSSSSTTSTTTPTSSPINPSIISPTTTSSTTGTSKPEKQANQLTRDEAQNILNELPGRLEHLSQNYLQAGQKLKKGASLPSEITENAQSELIKITKQLEACSEVPDARIQNSVYKMLNKIKNDELYQEPIASDFKASLDEIEKKVLVTVKKEIDKVIDDYIKNTGHSIPPKKPTHLDLLKGALAPDKLDFDELEEQTGKLNPSLIADRLNTANISTPQQIVDGYRWKMSSKQFFENLNVLYSNGNEREKESCVHLISLWGDKTSNVNELKDPEIKRSLDNLLAKIQENRAENFMVRPSLAEIRNKLNVDTLGTAVKTETNTKITTSSQKTPVEITSFKDFRKKCNNDPKKIARELKAFNYSLYENLQNSSNFSSENNEALVHSSTISQSITNYITHDIVTSANKSDLVDKYKLYFKVYLEAKESNDIATAAIVSAALTSPNLRFIDPNTLGGYFSSTNYKEEINFITTTFGAAPKLTLYTQEKGGILPFHVMNQHNTFNIEGKNNIATQIQIFADGFNSFTNVFEAQKNNFPSPTIDLKGFFEKGEAINSNVLTQFSDDLKLKFKDDKKFQPDNYENNLVSFGRDQYKTTTAILTNMIQVNDMLQGLSNTALAGPILNEQTQYNLDTANRIEHLNRLMNAGKNGDIDLNIAKNGNFIKLVEPPSGKERDQLSPIAWKIMNEAKPKLSEEDFVLLKESFKTINSSLSGEVDQNMLSNALKTFSSILKSIDNSNTGFDI